MQKAADILGPALRQLKDSEAAHAWLASNWPLIAGELVACHTRPVALHKGVFRIEANSTSWMHQVESMRTTICERINRAWGGTLVRRIHVEEQSRRGRRIPYAEDNAHTPFIRRPRKHETP